ncbi:MAG TPA: preprotein translocase subunit YajC [Bacteroidales bacterium]
MMTSTIFLQAAGGTGTMNLIIIVLMVVIMYVFMIRPQQKKQKEIAKFRSGLAVGDKVITAGGIHGKIKDIKETVIVIEIADNVRISVDRNSIFASSADAQQTIK